MRGMAIRLEEVSLLEELRADKGLSRTAVGEATGVSPKTIRSYEYALVEPKVGPLEALGKFYGVKASVLLKSIREHARRRESGLADSALQSRAA